VPSTKCFTLRAHSTCAFNCCRLSRPTNPHSPIPQPKSNSSLVHFNISLKLLHIPPSNTPKKKCTKNEEIVANSIKNSTNMKIKLQRNNNKSHTESKLETKSETKLRQTLYKLEKQKTKCEMRKNSNNR